MTNSSEARWHQRFENFENAFLQLEDACKKDHYSNLELAGLVRTFMFSYELSWKVLKDLLYYQGSDMKTPRDVIRQSFQVLYLNEDDCELFLKAIDERNKLSHIYNKEEARVAEELIKNQFFPLLDRLHQTLEQIRAE